MGICNLDRTTHVCDGIQGQVSGIAQLSPHSAVFQDRVHSLAVCSHCSGLEVFDILPDPQRFADQAELLLDGFEGHNETLGIVGAVKVPCIESCEVL